MTDKYRSLSPISHMHKRSEMYIGPVKAQTFQNKWIYSNNKLIKKIVTYSPGLERLFIEAMSNAIDNWERSKDTDNPCTRIKIEIKDSGETSIWNDGQAIPVVKKLDNGEELYIHTLVFGKLRSGENYDDEKKRYSSGRNGVGIKLTNAFSNKFIVKASDGIKNFKQEWTNHMRKAKKPRATTLKNQGKKFTQVIWQPDFTLFNCENYSTDLKSILYKHAYDCAMITGIPIYLDGKKIPIKSLKDYVKLHLDYPTKEIISFQSETCNVILTSSQKFEHVAFTNGIYNPDGGVHVDAWKTAIFRPLLQKINKPNKPHISINDILPYFKLFIISKIPNPEFSSQSKTKLTSPNVSVNVSEKDIKKIKSWKFIQEINDLIKGKELVKLKRVSRKSRKFKKIQGYDPANNAGKKHSEKCSLILCEGLSAKTYAVQGIQVGWNGLKGRDWFGIYPLRGKLLNVRNSKTACISKNKELSDVINALGVQFGIDYRDDANFKTLSYGRLMILCDSDVDGIHITGLIINFIHKLFPTLLQRSEPFIILMKTPIVKVSMKKKEILFYSQPKFKKFMAENPKLKYKTKYYKGLGTSSEKEVLATFGKKTQKLLYDETTDDEMNKAFSSKFSDQRKQWLTEYDNTFVHDFNSSQTISNFINKELILFSIDDCGRSIPNLYDGFKESHRKILYSLFKKNLAFSGQTMKVAQLAGYIAEQTNYHHGEQCLSCMTKMANDFPGSKNIPLLYPDGQFGSRLNGGKDAANARYIYTKQNKLTRLIFPKADDPLLNYIIDDGDQIEPDYYLPILPMILCNGCTAGIGTGWSCSVPQYNPLDLAEEIRKWLENEPFSELTPWYNGFKGNIKKLSAVKYETNGNFHKEGKDYVIDELPIGVWTDKYKEFLEGLLESKKLKSLKNYSTPTIVKFIIRPSTDFECNIQSLKLQSYVHISNMVLFTKPGVLHKFKSVNEILTKYCKKRFELYNKRKEYLLNKIREDLKYINCEKKFIKQVISKKLIIQMRDESDILKDMIKYKYYKKNGSFAYLLDMPMRRFSKNKIKELKLKISKLEKEYKDLENYQAKDMWLDELKEFIQLY